MNVSRRTLAIGALIAFGVVAAQPLACRALVGVEDRAETCGGGLALGECGVCQSERCCTYALACKGGAVCARYRECVAACPASDEPCRGRCANEHPEGASAVASLDDCARRQCSDTCGSWSCLGKVVWPVAPQTVTFTLKLTDAVDRHSLNGVKLAACSFTGCGEQQGVTDVNGAAKITLPSPRDGFVRVWGTEEKSGDGGLEAGAEAGAPEDAGAPALGYQALIFFSPPLSQDNVFVETGILTIETGRTIGGSAFPDIDIEAKGAVLVTTRDCDRLSTRGVAVDLAPRDPGVGSVYIDGVLPNTTLEETTQSGLAVFLNVPPSNAITVIAQSNVARRQTGARQILVRAGHVTYIEMPPMPERFP